MSISELHTVATNIKSSFLRKLNIYSSRTAQLVNASIIEMMDAPIVPRNNNVAVDPEFDLNILRPIGMNERLYQINPNLLLNSIYN